MLQQKFEKNRAATRIKDVSRKRINNSEPVQRIETKSQGKSDSESQKIEYEDSSNLKSQQNQLQKSSSYQIQQQMEQKMGESVISEYVLIDSNYMRSPTQAKRKYSGPDSGSDSDSDSNDVSEVIGYGEEEYKENDINYKKQQRKLKKQQASQFKYQNSKFQSQNSQNDDLSSQKATSEINALINIIEKEKRKPIYFNMMVAGESGSGKSTFISTFLSKRFQKINQEKQKMLGMVENKAQRKEGNIDFNINIIDTEGYSQSTNLQAWYQDIRNFIIQRYENFQTQQYRQLECFQNAEEFQQYQLQNQEEDCRIHLCLYFISGSRLRSTDIKMLKKLQKYVNIIPILSKGDQYQNKYAIKEAKNRILKEAESKHIFWFNIKDSLKSNPEYLKKLKEGQNGESPPFLLINKHSNRLQNKNFPLGMVGDISNDELENSDFNLLYTLLIGHLSMDLINNTNYYFLQYCRQKQEEEQLVTKKEEDQRNLILFGTLATLGLAVTSFFMKYREKQ